MMYAKLKPPFRLPVKLVVLDVLGAVLAAWGLFEWLAGPSMVPPDYRFQHYYVVMIVAGVLLMLPLSLFIVKGALGDKTRDR